MMQIELLAYHAIDRLLDVDKWRRVDDVVRDFMAERRRSLHKLARERAEED